MTEEKQFCPECGKELKADEAFCGECGAKNILYTETTKQVITLKKPSYLKNILMYLLITLPIAFFVAGILATEPSVIGGNGENVFQQIYSLVESTGIVLGIGVGISTTILLILGFWCVCKFISIERKLVDIQEYIRKNNYKE